MVVMTNERSPFVYWAQSEPVISLKVDLKDVAEHDIAISAEEMELTAIATGASGRRCNYHFGLEFYLPIDASASDYEVRDNEIRIRLRKQEPDWWPRDERAHPHSAFGNPAPRLSHFDVGSTLCRLPRQSTVIIPDTLVAGLPTRERGICIQAGTQQLPKASLAQG